jgi:hypothetical protein
MLVCGPNSQTIESDIFLNMPHILSSPTNINANSCISCSKLNFEGKAVEVKRITRKKDAFPFCGTFYFISSPTEFPFIYESIY